MEKRIFVYFLLLLSFLNKKCAGSTLKEPQSAHNDQMVGRDISGYDENTQVNIKSNVTNDHNNHFLYQTIGNVTQNFFHEKDDNIKKIVQLENKINELTSTMEKILKILNDSQASSTSSRSVTTTEGVPIPPKSNNTTTCYDKSLAFTGSSYLALAALPGWLDVFNMSMEVKATEPVTDGIIMYCENDLMGGFTSLAVRQGRLEFRFWDGEGFGPVLVLTANRTLPANEWTNIEVSRLTTDVSLRINSDAALEGQLQYYYNFRLHTPMFIGGVDESTVLNNKTAVSGGFKGCIKDVQLLYHNLKGPIDVMTAATKSADVQVCCN